MAQFSVNTHRLDPYKNFKFRVKWSLVPGGPDVYVAGLQKCGGLKKTTEMIEWRAAGDPSIVRKLTGRTNFQPISLEQGLTHDTTFEQWAALVNNTKDGDAGNSPRNFRKNITIELMNEAGQTVIAYKIMNAWVSEYQALADLDSNGKAVNITSLKLEHEGFVRDESVAEPAEL
jgi:phage tail-like protein